MVAFTHLRMPEDVKFWYEAVKCASRKRQPCPHLDLMIGGHDHFPAMLELKNPASGRTTRIWKMGQNGHLLGRFRFDLTCPRACQAQAQDGRSSKRLQDDDNAAQDSCRRCEEEHRLRQPEARVVPVGEQFCEERLGRKGDEWLSQTQAEEQQSRGNAAPASSGGGQHPAEGKARRPSSESSEREGPEILQALDESRAALLPARDLQKTMLAGRWTDEPGAIFRAIAAGRAELESETCVASYRSTILPIAYRGLWDTSRVKKKETRPSNLFADLLRLGPSGDGPTDAALLTAGMVRSEAFEVRNARLNALWIHEEMPHWKWSALRLEVPVRQLVAVLAEALIERSRSGSSMRMSLSGLEVEHEEKLTGERSGLVRVWWVGDLHRLGAKVRRGTGGAVGGGAGGSAGTKNRDDKHKHTRPLKSTG